MILSTTAWAALCTDGCNAGLCACFSPAFECNSAAGTMIFGRPSGQCQMAGAWYRDFVLTVSAKLDTLIFDPLKAFIYRSLVTFAFYYCLHPAMCTLLSPHPAYYCLTAWLEHSPNLRLLCLLRVCRMAYCGDLPHLPSAGYNVRSLLLSVPSDVSCMVPLLSKNHHHQV